MKKIGILGGTFDPIHEGHLTIARSAKEQFTLDVIFFVPALLPPHKGSEGNLTAAHHRFEMVKLAVKGIEGFEVSDIELRRPGISYTVDTLRQFHEIYPAANLFLILGADSLAQIGTWRESNEIFRLATLLVAPRGNLKVSTLDFPPRHMVWIRMPEIAVSSSQIRDRIRQGGETGPFLPPRVAKYICQHHLYTGRGPEN